MGNGLNSIIIKFCEPNGDTIIVHEVTDSLSALIPNVGDMVNADGTYREVSEKAFTYSSKSIIVQIYLEENN